MIICPRCDWPTLIWVGLDIFECDACSYTFPTSQAGEA